VAAVAVAGCGSSERAQAPPQVAREGPFGTGPNQVWVFRPSGKPKSVVVFIHGLGGHELFPENHRPWLEHLAARGSAVLYPRYERQAGDRGAVLHVLAGVRIGLKKLGSPDVPLVAIGYSRGGELVADYAAVARAAGPAAAAVVSVFPAAVDPADPPLDLRGIDPGALVTILVGDRDEVVDGGGARQLVGRLQQAAFPPERISVVPVRSHGGFVASHLAPLEVSPAAKDAFWKPADELIERVRANAAG
jgi:poly(3-hydroxybutyrate) depolymerase